MSDIKALLEFSQTQPWEAEKRLAYRWSCYNKHLNFMGPEDLGTCRVTGKRGKPRRSGRGRIAHQKTGLDALSSD